MSTQPEVTRRQTLHKGKKFDYQQVTVRMPSGKDVQRQMVSHPGAVVVVPILPGGQVVMMRVYRHTLQERSLECCAGTIDGREAPQRCARRELVEETGYEAGTLEPLGQFYTSPGMSDELMSAFVATDLKHVGQHLEEDEDIHLELMTPAALLERVRSGALRDGKSMLAIFLARQAGYLAP